MSANVVMILLNELRKSLNARLAEHLSFFSQLV